MNIHTHRSSFCHRHLAGWLGLLLYVGAFTPAGMGVVALLGAMDSDHQVRFQADAEGARLVMHHDARFVRHHHGVVARMLTAFAVPSSPTDPDHILQFSSTTIVKPDSQPQPPVGDQSEFKEAFVAVSDTLLAPRPSQFAALPRSPTLAGGPLSALRFTVLLI
jgi:hypothetical protein